MRRGGRLNVRAYTLVELMAVMVVLALVMGLAIPRADSMVPRYQLDRQAAEIAMTLRDARNRAVVSGKVIRLEIYPDQFEMHYFWDEPEVDDEGYLLAEDDEPFATKAWSDRIILDRALIGRDEALTGQAAVVLRFWPTGLSTPVRLYLYHKRAKQQRRTVELNPLTGLTRVLRGEVKPESYEMKVTVPTRTRGRR